jgi:hypothetical protein
MVGTESPAELMHMLVRASLRVDELEGWSNHACRLPPAEPKHWPEIERAFRCFGVPFDPAVREIYEVALGVPDPLTDGEPILALPFLSAHSRLLDENGCFIGTTDVRALDSYMNSHHLWPFENDDDEAFGYLCLGHSFGATLTIGPRGRWSTRPYDGDGGPLPEREDFTMSFESAFRTFTESQIMNWSCALADVSWKERRLILEGKAPPQAALEMREKLIAPMDLSRLPTAQVDLYRPSWLSAMSDETPE